jgi:uncharacterized RDD family membrane protein YckC
MFIIIGGDGKEYGPVTVDQIRTWIAAGRASLDTRAKAVGADEWRQLRDFAEFSGSSVSPPVLGDAPAAPAEAGELAGQGARTGAALLNALLYFLSMMPGSAARAAQLLRDNPQLGQGGFPDMASLERGALADPRFDALILAGLAAALTLQCALLAWRSQNLGKLVTGLRVVRAESGAPAGFMRGVLLRFLIPVGLIFGLNALLFPLGFLFLLVDFCFMFRQDRRCLHDLMAGTQVVRRK